MLEINNYKTMSIEEVKNSFKLYFKAQKMYESDEKIRGLMSELKIKPNSPNGEVKLRSGSKIQSVELNHKDIINSPSSFVKPSMRHRQQSLEVPKDKRIAEESNSGSSSQNMSLNNSSSI